MARFAILLPIKIVANHLDALQLSCLQQLVQSIAFTPTAEAVVYLGLDEYLQGSASEQHLQDLFAAHEVHTHHFTAHTAGQICFYWNQLACAAGADNCDFFVLLGDDVQILGTDGWMDSVVEDFHRLHRAFPQHGFGFGCIAIPDLQAPGFPTFPVLHRSHLDRCNGRVFPDAFVNQDADPFLFALYRRWGTAVYATTARLRNMTGGVELLGDPAYTLPRYNRKHVNWSGELLESAVEQMDQVLG